MKLDRNIKENRGRGKYALLNVRKMFGFPASSIAAKEVKQGLECLAGHGLEWGKAGTESEFFVIRLKDKYAKAALVAYAREAAADDPEWALEVLELALRSGTDSKWCKRPD